MDEKVCEQRILICIPTYRSLCYLENLKTNNQNTIAVVTDDKVIRDFFEYNQYCDVVSSRPNEKFFEIREKVRKVIICDEDIVSTCSMLEKITNSVCAPIIILTKNTQYPGKLFTNHGANHVVYTNNTTINFLIEE